MMVNGSGKAFSTFLTEASIVALLWVMLYELNDWMFANLEVTSHINWIFLPAALRMLSVMILGWSGAAGLFIGAMITNAPVLGENLGHALIGSTLTALGPVAASALASKILKTAINFEGIRPRDLYIFALIGSLLNVVPHCIWFSQQGLGDPWSKHFVPMFVGDMIGTAILLHTASLAINVLKIKLR